MKKQPWFSYLRLFLFGIVFFSVIGWLSRPLWQSVVSSQPVTESSITSFVSPLTSPIATVIPSPDIIRSRPTRLQIPTLNIDTAVEWVGEDEQGRMDVPVDANNVAWYQKGPLPGELGSAVLAGHLDTPTGPAIFAHLAELTAGDRIYLTDEQGLEQTFVVEEVDTYKDATFPLKYVFSRKDASRLNLITCSGTFDSQTKNYSDRFVVFARLVEEPDN
jgi:LPXTG-site transpeptidase (sortase) family protein